MPRPLRPLPIARCPVAPEHHHRCGQALMQIAAICPDRTPLRISPTPCGIGGFGQHEVCVYQSHIKLAV
jgi:hypothetical protein